MIIFNPSRLEELGVDNETKLFLSTVGLPNDAAPYLTFIDDKLRSELEGIYSDDDPGYKCLVIIGSDDAGDFICIDVVQRSEVVTIDHEDGYKKRFMNSSAKTLFAFLTIYKSFIQKLQDLRGEDAYLDADFTDQEMDELLREFESVDERALSQKENFWWITIQNSIAMRDEIRKHRR